jgi:hypothetical protein
MAPSLKRVAMRAVGQSDTAKTKQRIQALLRSIVIERDGGCILKSVRHCADTVLQADHLITRANSATFGDSRLVVCLCRSCHAWKSLGDNMRKAHYDYLVREILPEDRVRLWDQCERESWQPHPVREADWRLTEVLLKAELALRLEPNEA